MEVFRRKVSCLSLSVVLIDFVKVDQLSSLSLTSHHHQLLHNSNGYGDHNNDHSYWIMRTQCFYRNKDSSFMTVIFSSLVFLLRWLIFFFSLIH